MSQLLYLFLLFLSLALQGYDLVDFTLTQQQTTLVYPSTFYLTTLLDDQKEQHNRRDFFINVLLNNPIYYNKLIHILDSQSLFNIHPRFYKFSYKNYLMRQALKIGESTILPPTHLSFKNFLAPTLFYRLVEALYPLIGIRECRKACSYTRTRENTIREEFENHIENFIQTAFSSTSYNLHLITFADPFLMTTLRSLRHFSANHLKRLSVSTIDTLYKPPFSTHHKKNLYLLYEGLNHILESLGTTLEETPFDFYESINHFKKEFFFNNTTLYLIIGIDLEGSAAQASHTLEDFLELCDYIPSASIIVATRSLSDSSFIIVQEKSILRSIFNDYINRYSQ